MSGLVEVPLISVSPSECLFGQFQLDLGFWLKCYCGEVCGLRLKYTTLDVLAESGGGIYSLGTSRNLNSFNCRSPI